MKQEIGVSSIPAKKGAVALGCCSPSQPCFEATLNPAFSAITDIMCESVILIKI